MLDHLSNSVNQKGKRMPNVDLLRPPQDMRELNLLEELEKNPVVSQRELSQKFGIALGVTNACLKRMIRMGWIRITGFNHHKIGYYLTPKGHEEKSRLSLHVISWNVQHYTALKDLIGGKLLEIQNAGMERVVFYGVSEELEIALITIQDTNLKLVGIVEDDEVFLPRIIFGYELERVNQIRGLKPKAILITSLKTPDAKREKLRLLMDDKIPLVTDISSEGWDICLR